MKIAISGSSGLIGQKLSTHLKNEGHDIFFLVRSKKNDPHFIYWNLETSEIENDKLEDMDAVIHLAGATVSQKWSETYKAMIKYSRIKGTRLLCQTILKLKNPPRVFLSASAIGYYGNRKQEMLIESSKPGAGFLSETCHAWEAETDILKKSLRVCLLRLGIVLDKNGGALQKMLPAFKMGLGGVVGCGHQYMSWISLEDVISIFSMALTNANCKGPINVTSPNPVINKEFTKTLSSILKRPSFFKIPSFVIKTLMGEMGEELLLASTFAYPGKLMDLKYEFKFPDLKKALKYILS